MRDEGAVERGEPEPRQVVGRIRRKVGTEDESHLLAQAFEGELAHAVDDSVHLSVAGVGGLRGHYDEDPQEVGMAVERRRDGSDQRLQVLALRAHAPVRGRQLGKKRSAPRSITATSTPSFEPK